jgi:hypothetical protein
MLDWIQSSIHNLYSNVDIYLAIQKYALQLIF